MTIGIHTVTGGAARISNLVRIAIAVAMAFMSVAVMVDVAISESGGSISGCVRSDNDTPIEGAHVVVYGWDSEMFVGEVHTIQDGTYSIAGLTSGRYRVKANAAGYFAEYYREGGMVPITVFPSYATCNIDFTLTPGTSVSGHVYQEDGVTPIIEASVVAYQKVGNAWEYVAEGYSDADGGYSITTGMGAGTYRVKSEAAGYAAEYYSAVFDPALFDEIRVSAGECMAGIDFRLNRIGFISGTAYRADGVTPISGVRVVAYDGATGGSIGEGFSGPNAGRYYINVSPGTYRLRAEGAGCVGEWYADASTFAVATPVSVYGLEGEPDINFTLEPIMEVATLRARDLTSTSARLNGTITSTGAANEVVVSFVWGIAAESYTHETPRQVRNGEGYFLFVLNGLTPGTTHYYRAKAVGGDGDTFYGEERSFTTMDDVAPIISWVNCNTTAFVATVTWTTDEPATSQIDYGLTEDYGTSTGEDLNLVTSHLVSLGDLSANSTYHYQITCRDASGNKTTLSDDTFRTDEYYGGMATATWKIVGFALAAVVVAAFCFTWVKAK